MPPPSQASYARAGSNCPTCGASTEEDQLVCLECGSRVGLEYRRPPSWRVPVAIIAAVVVLMAVAGALAFDRLGDDAEREARSTPIRTKAGAREKADAGKPGATDGGLVRRGDLYSWPRELEGFTVVLQRTPDRAAADTFAREAAEGAPAKIGVIRTDDFTNLEAGFFVVFAGRYETPELADAATERLRGRFSGASPQAIER